MARPSPGRGASGQTSCRARSGSLNARCASSGRGSGWRRPMRRRRSAPCRPGEQRRSDRERPFRARARRRLAVTTGVGRVGPTAPVQGPALERGMEGVAASRIIVPQPPSGERAAASTSQGVHRRRLLEYQVNLILSAEPGLEAVVEVVDATSHSRRRGAAPRRETGAAVEVVSGHRPERCAPPGARSADGPPICRCADELNVAPGGRWPPSPGTRSARRAVPGRCPAPAASCTGSQLRSPTTRFLYQLRTPRTRCFFVTPR